MTTEPTTITAPAGTQTISIVRDFTTTPATLWRCLTEPDLVSRWMGPDALTTTVEANEVRDGGRWRMIHTDADGNQFAFRGVYHGPQSPELSLRTFEWEGLPGHVSMEWSRIEDLGDGTCRLHTDSVFMSVQDRDGMIESGMDVGVKEGYARLDTILEGL